MTHRDGRTRKGYLVTECSDARRSRIQQHCCDSKHLRFRGLSLIELLIAVAILAIVVSLAYPSYVSYLERVRVEMAKADIMNIVQAIERFRLAHNGHLPDDLSQIGMDMLKDPWGNPYQYLNIASAKNKGKLRKNKSLVPINTDFDLYSMGADGRSAAPLTAAHSRDDVIRANDGGFLGLASDY